MRLAYGAEAQGVEGEEANSGETSRTNDPHSRRNGFDFHGCDASLRPKSSGYE
jgi:hypothetical protein